MKLKPILLVIIAGLGYVALTSNAGGVAGNLTGSGGGATGCGGTGCHGTGATTGIAINVALDSAGIMVSHYQPGMSYRIRVTGINATTGTLPQFGYQLSAFTGTAGTGAVQAGSFTSLPVSSAVTTIGSLSVLGSTAAISSTGSGTTGDIDTFTVGWVAPPAGSGTVNMYAVVCAANGDAIEGTEDKWNKVSSTFTELLPTNGVAGVTSTLGISAFPNPVTATLNLRVNGTGNGVYSISAFGLNGHQVASESVQGGNGGLMAIDMADCAPGLYQVVIEKDGVKQVIPVVKQ